MKTIEMKYLNFLYFTMLFFFTCVCIISCEKAGETKLQFTEDTSGQGCFFNYYHENSKDKRFRISTTPGHKYSSSSKSKFLVCCKDKVDPSQIDIMKRDLNCCLYQGDSCYYDGMRTCSYRICVARFPDSPATKVIENKDPDKMFIRKLCPDIQKPNNKGIILIYPESDELTGYTDRSFPCKDQSMKVKITYRYTSLDNDPTLIEPIMINWCCSKDIFMDYTLDPKKLCCGLAGAGAPNFYPGAYVHVDAPPCCRKIQNRIPCEPYVKEIKYKFQKKKIMFNQFCPLVSGRSDLTSNLKEVLPYFTPQYFALNNGDISSYITGRCDFFEVGERPLYSTNDLQTSTKTHYGICCTKDTGDSTKFPHPLLDFKLLMDVCCVGITDNNQGKEKIGKIPCDDSTNGKGKVDNNIFYPRPCKPTGCSNSNLIDRKNETVDTIFGSRTKSELETRNRVAYNFAYLFLPRYAKNPNP